MERSGDAFATTGTLAPARVAVDPSQGVVLGAGEGAVTLTPTAVAPDASPPVVIGGDALVFANTAAASDTSLRPTALGVETFTQLRGDGAPETQSWKVTVGPGESLQRLDDGSVALLGQRIAPPDEATPPPTASPLPLPIVPDVIDLLTPDEPPPLPPPDPAAAPEPLSDEETQAITDADAQRDAAVAALVAAEQETRREALVVFSEPKAVDANGQGVAATLTADGDEITMTVDHRAPGVVHPVVADPTATAASAFGDFLRARCREAAGAVADLTGNDGTRFCALSKDQIDYCLRNAGGNVALCIRFFGDAEKALDLSEHLFTQSIFGAGNTKASTFNHAFWTALMVKSRGPDQAALEFAVLHEHGAFNSSDPERRLASLMDIHNDVIGWNFTRAPENKNHNEEYQCFWMAVKTLHGIKSRSMSDWRQRRGAWITDFNDSRRKVDFNGNNCSPA